MHLPTTVMLASVALAAGGLAVAAPAVLADGTSKTVLVGDQSTTIGTGTKTCVLKPGADCRGVVHRWTVEHHGNLRKAKFTGAHLHGADFRGANLGGADFRGAKLRHADLRGAKLKGARFHAPPGAGKQANQTPSCSPSCQGADLSHANLSNANLIGANLTSANLTSAFLYNAYLNGANLTNADLSYAILDGANLDASSLYGANFYWASAHNVTLGNSTVGWGQANWTSASGCSTVTPNVLPIRDAAWVDVEQYVGLNNWSNDGKCAN